MGVLSKKSTRALVTFVRRHPKENNDPKLFVSILANINTSIVFTKQFMIENLTKSLPWLGCMTYKDSNKVLITFVLRQS